MEGTKERQFASAYLVAPLHLAVDCSVGCIAATLYRGMGEKRSGKGRSGEDRRSGREE